MRFAILAISLLLSSCGLQVSKINSDRAAALDEAAKSLASSIVGKSNGSIASQGLSFIVPRIFANLENKFPVSTISEQGLIDSVLTRCLTATGNTSDLDKDGIYANAIINVNCSYGTSPGRNWIVYNGMVSQVDQNDQNNVSGYKEVTSNLKATYYDDYGNVSNYNISISTDVALRPLSGYGIIYNESIIKNGSGSGGEFSGVYTPSIQKDPYNGGSIIGKGSLFNQATSALADNVTANNLYVSDACGGASSGSIATNSMTLDYTSCNTYDIR